MKKIRNLLCLLLALMLCVSLAACASAEDKAFEEANALLEAGDYDGAIAAFSTIGRYQEITSKIEEATILRNRSNAGFLFGTWRDLYRDVTFTFTEDGEGTIVTEDTTESISYTCADGTVTITSPFYFDMKVSEVDGVMHITTPDGGYDLVTEADYEVVGPKQIEITMDNWNEYFELREADNVYVNQFGEVESSMPGYGVFLKEELYDRIVSNYGAIDVDFELTYDEACFKVVDYDKETFDYNFMSNYTMEPCNAPSWWEVKSGCTVTSSVYDQRQYLEDSELNPYYQKIAAQFHIYGAWGDMGSTLYYNGFVNAQISRVQGSITLLP